MWVFLRRRLWQLAFLTIAVPAAAWFLEEAARRREARHGPSPATVRMRRWSESIGGFGRGPFSRSRRR